LLGEGLFASPTALAQLHRSVGDTVTLVIGERRLSLRIAGELPAARDAIATMDLGFAQWRLGRLGLLSRIDVKFAPGADIAAAQRAWQLPIGLRTERAEVARDREQALSRAYRVKPGRAVDGGAVHRRLPGVFIAVAGGGRAPPAARPAQDARATRAQIARMLIAERPLSAAWARCSGWGWGRCWRTRRCARWAVTWVAAISPALTRASRSIRSVRCCSSLSVWAPRSWRMAAGA